VLPSPLKECLSLDVWKEVTAMSILWIILIIILVLALLGFFSRGRW
jgi:hypothetical protein